MSREYLQRSFDDIADAIETAGNAEREVLIEIAGSIDPRLADQFVTMLDCDGYSKPELTAMLETIEPRSTESMYVLIDQRLTEMWQSPVSKKQRRRENWQAFVRGLGGVGAGMAAIGEGMATIGSWGAYRRSRRDDR